MSIKRWVVIGLWLGLMGGGVGLGQVMAQSCNYPTQAACVAVRGCNWDTSQLSTCQSLPVASCTAPCSVVQNTQIHDCTDDSVPCPSKCNTEYSPCSGFSQATCKSYSGCSWSTSCGGSDPDCKNYSTSQCLKIPGCSLVSSCSGSYATSCSGSYLETGSSYCTYTVGGECVGRPCNCDWNAPRCVSGSGVTPYQSYSCDGCYISNQGNDICSGSRFGCDDSNDDLTCEEVCVANEGIVNGSATSLPVCGTLNGYSSSIGCDTVALPNRLIEVQCQYGCGSDGRCRPKPDTEPYCENTAVCNLNTQQIKCWPSYDDSVCNEPQVGVVPACNEDGVGYYGYTLSTITVEACGVEGCRDLYTWCEEDDPPRICPPASKPNLTQLWKGTCGTINCKDPSVKSCSTGASPPPPPPPGSDTPSCSITSISLDPNPPEIGSEVAITVVVDWDINNVDYVSLQILRDDGNNVTLTDNVPGDGYVFHYTPPDNVGFRVRAAGIYNESAAEDCELETGITYQPVPPTTTVNVHTYQTDTDCSLTEATALNGVTVGLSRIFPPFYDFGNGTTTNGSYSWSPVSADIGITYRVSAYPLQNYVYQACGQGASIRDFTITDSQLKSYNRNFYFTLMADPWFQIYHGDVGAAGGSISSLVSGDGNTFLAQTTADASGVAMASGTVTASPVGPSGREWRVNGAAFPTVTSWYNYFTANFDQLPTLVEGDITIKNTNFTSFSWVDHIEEVDNSSHILFVNGNVIVNGDIDVPSGKWTVFINNGSLIVNSANIDVPTGNFLGFVTTGNISFAGTTRTIEGVYVADGTLTVDNTVSGIGIARQFKGEGIFVGQNGVTLRRNLDNQTNDTDDLANNTAAAQTFTYRPDFVINAPRGFLRSGVTWQEVAPGAVVPPEFTPETTPPTQTCQEAGYKCVSVSLECNPNTTYTNSCESSQKCVNMAANCMNPPSCTEGAYRCSDASTSQQCVGSDWVSTSCPFGCQSSDGRCGACVNEGGSCALGQTCCNPLQCELGVCRSEMPPETCDSPQTSPHYVEAGGDCVEQLGCGYNDYICL